MVLRLSGFDIRIAELLMIVPCIHFSLLEIFQNKNLRQLSRAVFELHPNSLRLRAKGDSTCLLDIDQGQ